MYTVTDMLTLQNLGQFPSEGEAEQSLAALAEDGRIALARRCKVLRWPVTRWGLPGVKPSPFTYHPFVFATR
jgi:hypothetical protein